MTLQPCFHVIILVCLLAPINAFIINTAMFTGEQKIDRPHPVVLVPGDGGCQAFAKFKGVNSDPFPLWVDLRYLITPKTFGDYFKLIYDPVTHTTSDSDKATISFPGWGHTWSLDNLDSNPHSVTNYFGDVTATFLNNSFYVQNHTLRGSPFDFRKGPNEHDEFFFKLRELIEETYFNGGKQRVVLIAHSLGTLMTLKFLKDQPDKWKQHYIKSFVCTAGPLGGAVKALKIEASGDNFGIYFESSLWYREVQRSMPSLAFLLPDPRLWGKDETVVFTPKRNYTVHQYEHFFEDINYTVGYQMHIDTSILVDSFEGPTGIDEVYCFHGSKVPTTSGMIYTPANAFHNEFPDQMPTVLYGDGDGTVNLRSLEVCSRWNGVKYETLPNADHLGIMQDQRFLERVLDIAKARPLRKPKSWVEWTMEKFQ